MSSFSSFSYSPNLRLGATHPSGLSVLCKLCPTHPAFAVPVVVKDIIPIRPALVLIKGGKINSSSKVWWTFFSLSRLVATHPPGLSLLFRIPFRSYLPSNASSLVSQFALQRRRRCRRRPSPPPPLSLPNSVLFKLSVSPLPFKPTQSRPSLRLAAPIPPPHQTPPNLVFLGAQKSNLQLGKIMFFL